MFREGEAQQDVAPGRLRSAERKAPAEPLVPPRRHRCQLHRPAPQSGAHVVTAGNIGRSIRTIRAHFIEARRATPLHQQAGYTAAILSLSRDHEAQNGRRPYTDFSPTTGVTSHARSTAATARLKPGLQSFEPQVGSDFSP